MNAVAHRDYSMAGARVRLHMFGNRLELHVPGALANTLTPESMDSRQYSRNELIVSLLARCPVSEQENLVRSHMMDRRGEGVPIILDESRELSGRVPEYTLLDDSELRLVIWAAGVQEQNAAVNAARTRKKLIEVALPLDAINKASAREKSIRHGHPSTLHLWWARRPLAAARAVIFAQIGRRPDRVRRRAVVGPEEEAGRDACVEETSSGARGDRWRLRRIWRRGILCFSFSRAGWLGDRTPCRVSCPTGRALRDMAAELERERLFDIIEELVLWENTTNEEVLERARTEIWQSWRRACAANADHPRAAEIFDRNRLPAFHDPFAGGGTLPLEAQRLGLEAHASDLNPVAVLINKAMIEIPREVRGYATREPGSEKERGPHRTGVERGSGPGRRRALLWPVDA